MLSMTPSHRCRRHLCIEDITVAKSTVPDPGEILTDVISMLVATAGQTEFILEIYPTVTCSHINAA